VPSLHSPLCRALARVLIAALLFALVPIPTEASIPRAPLTDPRPPVNLELAAPEETAHVVVVILIADPSGLTKTAFGEVYGRTGTDPIPYAFAGEPLDPNSGFQYHRARWMDSTTGRFTGMDPWEGSAFDPSTLHRYLYAAADPVNRLDPSGELSIGTQGFTVGAIQTTTATQVAAAGPALAVKKLLALAVVGAFVAGTVASPIAELIQVFRRRVPPGGLFVFGNSTRPDPVKPRDFGVMTEPAMVEPRPADPLGKSAWGRWGMADLTGWVWQISVGLLPPGLWLVADGRDVRTGSRHNETHHTIMPAWTMSYTAYYALVEPLLLTATKVTKKTTK
jgi:RHS repeat-associated protein